MLLDITIESGGTDWSSIMIPLLAGLGGAAIGAISIFLLEIWKQVLEFRAAGRVICYEMVANVISIKVAVEADDAQDVELVDEAWTAHRSSLALLLDEVAYRHIAARYRVLPLLRRILRQTLEMPHAEKPGVYGVAIGANIETLKEVQNLRVICDNSRFDIFLHALRGKTFAIKEVDVEHNGQTLESLISTDSPQPRTSL